MAKFFFFFFEVGGIGEGVLVMILNFLGLWQNPLDSLLLAQFFRSQISVWMLLTSHTLGKLVHFSSLIYSVWGVKYKQQSLPSHICCMDQMQHTYISLHIAWHEAGTPLIVALRFPQFCAFKLLMVWGHRTLKIMAINIFSQ